jgi:predicted ATPase
VAAWRGPALADLLDDAGGAADAVRLDELRLTAIEAHVEAELALGRASTVLDQLAPLAAEHPLRERLQSQLVLALHRSGRQAEALRAFERSRVALAELGLEPGRELRDAERTVLDTEPTLAGPPPAGPGARRHVPRPASRFIGRAREREQLVARLTEHRLVTLTGPGGAGKTRLALEVAAGDERGQAWFVELAPVRPGPGVGGAVAEAVGAHDVPGSAATAPLARAVARLAGEQGLLVLDNCEHVLDDAAAVAAAVLRDCAGVRILATSREALSVGGEAVLALGSLDAADAAALFATRAEAVRAGFDLDEERASLVHELCGALDGMPLAIELAAARVSSMPLEQIARRLDDRFRLLTGGDRSAEPRQQTLRAAVEWSYDLLFEHERELFVRCSVFAGPFGVESAAAIAPGDLDELDVLEVLGRLVDKSLLELRGDRYGMLETLRQFGAEQLERAGAADDVRRAHAEHLAGVARQAEAALLTPDQLPGLARLEQDRADLRSAIDWATEADHALALELAGAVAGSWWIRGYGPEARFVLDAVLRRGPAEGVAGARALRWAAHLVDATGWADHEVEVARELALAERRAAEAVATLDGTDVRVELAHALRQHAISLVRLATYQGDRAAAARAAELLARSVEVSAAAGDRWGVAFSRMVEGVAAVSRGDLEAAREAAEAAWPDAVATGERLVLERTLMLRGLVAEASGRPDEAADLHHQGLAVAEELGFAEAAAAHRLHLRACRDDHGGVRPWAAAPDELAVAALTRVQAAQAATRDGDRERAATLYGEAIEHFTELGMSAEAAAARDALAHLSALA